MSSETKEVKIERLTKELDRAMTLLKEHDDCVGGMIVVGSTLENEDYEDCPKCKVIVDYVKNNKPQGMWCARCGIRDVWGSAMGVKCSTCGMEESFQ